MTARNALRQKLQSGIKCPAALVLLCCLWSGLTCATEDETLGSALDALAASDSAAFAAVAEELGRLADAGNTQAANVLATALYVGDLVPADHEAALTRWQQAADAGNSTAQFNVGIIALQQSRDPALAERMLRQAAEQGDAIAAFAFGSMMAERGAATETSSRWFQQAASEGYPPAQYNLARVLLDGTVDQVNTETARRWLMAAAATFGPARTLLQTISAAAPEPEPDVARGIHNREWVSRQAPELFTIQAGASSNPDALRRMLERHARDHVSAWFLHRPRASEPFTAIIGNFESREEAEAALAALPRAVKTNAPWIRPLAVIQREIQSNQVPP